MRVKDCKRFSKIVTGEFRSPERQDRAEVSAVRVTGHCAVFDTSLESRKLRRDRSLRLESLGRRSES